MDQISFAEAEYNYKKKKTRREKFLEQMDKLIPWKRLENRIRRHYPTPGNEWSPALSSGSHDPAQPRRTPC